MMSNFQRYKAAITNLSEDSNLIQSYNFNNESERAYDLRSVILAESQLGRVNGHMCKQQAGFSELSGWEGTRGTDPPVLRYTHSHVRY